MVSPFLQPQLLKLWPTRFSSASAFRQGAEKGRPWFGGQPLESGESYFLSCQAFFYYSRAGLNMADKRAASLGWGYPRRSKAALVGVRAGGLRV